MELAEIFVHLNGIRTNLKTPFGASRWRLCTMIKLPYIAVLQFHNAPWLRNRRLRRHINRTRGENAVATIDLVRSLRRLIHASMELAEIFVHLNGIRTNLKTPFGASRWRLCTMIKLPYIAVLQFHNAPWLRNRRLRRHINRTRGENAVATIDLVRSLRIVYISIILLLIFVALRLCRC